MNAYVPPWLIPERGRGIGASLADTLSALSNIHQQNKDMDLRKKGVEAANQLHRDQLNSLDDWRKSQDKDKQDGIKERATQAAGALEEKKREHEDMMEAIDKKIDAANTLAGQRDDSLENRLNERETAAEKREQMRLDAESAKEDKREAAAEALRASRPDKETLGKMDFPDPRQPAGTESSDRVRFTGVPVNDPIINSVLGTNAPPGTGTNYSRLLPAPLPSASQPPRPGMGDVKQYDAAMDVPGAVLKTAPSTAVPRGKIQAPTSQDAVERAKAAIAKGADKTKVNQRLKDAGFPPIP